MSHNLDITEGVVSYADSRSDAWHGLGQQVNHAMTAEEALQEAQLAGWNVRKEALFLPDGSQIPDRVATVRTNPVNGEADYLGVVGSGYTVIQNESHADMLNALVDSSGAHFETAGALRGGKEVFVTMKLPETMDIDTPLGVDKTEIYIAALNSHDGGGAFRIMVTPVRIVCRNTQIAAINRATSTWAIRHTSNALAAVSVARESLGLTFKYINAFEDEIKKMVDAQIEQDTAEALIGQVFDLEGAGSERIRDNRQAHVNSVLGYLGSSTNAGIENTRYGLYNAVTEYMDHGWALKGGDTAGLIGSDKPLRGSFADFKSRAFSLMKV